MRISLDPVVEVEGKVERETEKAYLFLADEWDEADWIPKSQVRAYSKRNGTEILTLTEWIAKKKGLA